MARIAILPKLITELLSQNHMLSVNEMLVSLKKNGEIFNKTSVYRTLEKLQGDGLVCKESFGESESLYELRKDHHDHAICSSCEKVIAIECCDHANKKIFGFKVDHHHTTIYGICSDCLK